MMVAPAPLVSFLRVYWWVPLLGLLYALTSVKGVAFGDGVGFVLTAQQPQPDWATNATSHLLYQLINWVLVRIFPGTSPPYVVWAVSGLASLGCLVVLFRLLLKIGLEVKAGTIATMMLGLSFTFWRHAVMQEVYPLYWLGLVGCWYYVWAWVKTGDLSNLWILSALTGLLLLVHISHVLFLPVLVWLLFVRRAGFANTMLCLLITTLVASPLVILPLLHGQSDILLIIRTCLLDDLSTSEVLGLTFGRLLLGAVFGLGLLSYNFPIVLGTTAFRLFNRRLGFRAFIEKIKSSIFMQVLMVYLLVAVAYAVRFPNLQVAPFYVTMYIVLVLLWAQSGYFDHLRLPSTLISPVVYLLCYGWLIYGPLPELLKDKLSRFEQVKAYKGGLAYYMLPWQNATPDALDVAKAIETRKNKTYTPADSLVIQDLGYNWPQLQLLLIQQKQPQ